jgi:hypothetical protein
MADCQHNGGTHEASEGNPDGTVTVGVYCNQCDQMISSRVE